MSAALCRNWVARNCGSRRATGAPDAGRSWRWRVWEIDAPEGIEPIEWLLLLLLLSSEPVNNLEDALRIAGYYSLRWLIASSITSASRAGAGSSTDNWKAPIASPR